MFAIPNMPSTSSVLSTYTAIAASTMLVRTVINEVQTITSHLLPQKLQEKLLSSLGGLFKNASQLTLIIDEYNCADYSGGPWGSINLDHPSTFETLAMDPILKQELVDDLDRFVKRKDFYKRVGKKRGYLLYGPPGTGKSSLIAAMANYLKFDIYDLELTSLHGNSDLRRLLTATANRSKLVIEDIDCSIDLQDRQHGGYDNGESQLTLSGLLNFIDGLWSSCGDERITVFTTNYEDKLDPALLRTGRMDMQINMSYCTAKQLIKEEVQVTPAEVAEELMKGDDVEAVLEGVVEFLRSKKEMKYEESESQVEENKANEDENEKEK
ncbi:hypothetical protein JCGZ_17939 [Jatropha curcas]|uniref:AAA+ ATPase domain-containing protein n=1 Tax=Jatropha curcas TaxID=180498 RepID=A0A067JS60_JATCU|nr:hypothetical protein JCGZ_17939 [Jatropha curcas]